MYTELYIIRFYQCFDFFSVAQSSTLSNLIYEIELNKYPQIILVEVMEF